MSLVTIPSYDECVRNLNGFIQTLMKNPSKILFLYFTMKQIPYVKTKFGKWEFTTQKETYYVLPGDDEHFAYVYRDTHLKALIDMVNPNEVSPFNVSFDASAPIDHKYAVSIAGPSSLSSVPPTNEVHVGNHLDFSIRHYSRQQNKVRVISSHLTKYIIDANGSAFRDAQVQADFTLEQVPSSFVDSIEDFNKTKHEIRGLITPISLDIIFDQDEEWLLPMFNLTRVCLGMPQKGGGNKKYYNLKNKKFLVKRGPKGGEYIVVGEKRRYLKRQSGGDIDIETIVMGEHFSKLLYDMFVFPMRNVKRNIIGVKVIFDYGHELTEYKDTYHLVLMYEFESGQKVDIFIIDGDTLLNAIEEMHDINSNVKPNLEKVAVMAERCKSMLERVQTKSKSIATN